jgi:hypothetical protein
LGAERRMGAERTTGRILPRGCLVRYREWYGKGAADNSGLKLTAEQVGDGIVEREEYDPKLSYAVLDPSAFRVESGPSIAERINGRLIKKGYAAFHEADNKRVQMAQGTTKRGPMSGWDQLRARMVGDAGTPMIVCFSTCTDSIRTIPVLQHDDKRPEDLDTNSEDHCFAAGTLVETDRGPKPIESLVGTDGRVLSINGYADYRSARLTRRNAEIVRLTFSDGREIVCTKDHRFLVDFDEWRYAYDLPGRSVLCAQSSSVQRFRSLMASAITSAANTFRTKVGDFISRFGSFIAAQFQKAIISTMETRIGPIIGSATSNVSLSLSILATGTAGQAEIAESHIFPRHKLRPPLGMDRKQGAIGTLSILRSISSPRWIGAFLPFARNVARIIWLAPRASLKESSAAQIVGRALCVSVEEAGKADVYCLTVPATGCFAIEGGLLVSNCADDWRYACMSRPYRKTPLAPEPPRDGYAPPSTDIPSGNFKVM